MSKRRASEKKSRAHGGADAPWIAPVLLLVCVGILFGSFLFSNGMLFGTDTIPMGYAARKVYTDLANTVGGIPLWNPYLLGGIPTVDGLFGGDMFYPTTLLQFIMPVYRALGIKLVIHIFLAGIFFYMYGRQAGLGRTASLAGCVGYAFAPYIISLIYAGHDGKLFVTALVPLAFYALERLLRDGRVFDQMLFALSIGLMILTAHLQLAFFACGALAFRFVWEAVALFRAGEKQRLTRITILFVTGALLGGAIGAIQTYPAYVYTGEFSPRAGGVTYEFATSWSIHWEEAVSLIIPEFGHYLSFYWGENPFKLNCESPGFLIMLLVVCGLFRWKKDPALRFWYVLLVITLIYALGGETPFFRIIYEVVPKFFRAPSTILFLFSFGSCVIAARVLDAYMKQDDRDALVKGAIATGAFLLLLLLGSLAGEGFWSAWGNVVRGGLTPEQLRSAAANGPELQKGILISGLLGVLFLGLLMNGSKWGIPRNVIAAGLGMLVFANAWRTDVDFVQVVPFEQYFQKDATIQAMQADDSLFRALSLIPNYQGNYFMTFDIEAANGFFDNKVRWYDELMQPANWNNLALLSMTNVKYILASGPVNHPTLEQAASSNERYLYRNRAVLPRAFLVPGFEIVAEPDERLARLTKQEIDFTQIVLLEEDPGITASSLPAGSVQWISQGPDEYSLRVEAPEPQLLFVSNNYLPYWRATIDGKDAPLLRANHAFQAVPVPAGAHEVSIRYRSGPVTASTFLSLGALVLVVAAGAGSRWRGGALERTKGGTS